MSDHISVFISELIAILALQWVKEVQPIRSVTVYAQALYL